MRLTDVLLPGATASNTLFPNIDAPLAPLTLVLETLRDRIRAKTQDIYSFEKELGKADLFSLGAAERDWLNSLLVEIAGHRPPLVIERIPHKTPSGQIKDNIHDLHIFVSKPLNLSQALFIQASETSPENIAAAQAMLEQDPFEIKTTPTPHVTAQLYDKHDPNTAHYPMLSDGLADRLDEILHALDPAHYEAPGPAPRINDQQLKAIVRSLSEWHLSLSLAAQGKIGLSSLTARMLSLDLVQTVESLQFNAFAFGKREQQWKRDFQLPRPVGGPERLNDRRLSTLSGWLRHHRPSDLVDQPLPSPDNREYIQAAQAYSDFVENESWTDKGRPDPEDRPIRPICWPHVTEVDKVPMSTAGAVILSQESNILETIVVLQKPDAIITERFAIIGGGEIPASAGDALIGQPLTRIIDHPLLYPVPAQPDTQLIVKAVEPLIGERANQSYNQAPADRAAWEYLHQYFAANRIDSPPYIVAMGMTFGGPMINTPVPGCTLIRFEGRPILPDTELTTLQIVPEQANSLKRILDFNMKLA